MLQWPKLINEFEEHSTMLNVTLLSAEDLHGRLIAALRNNELEVNPITKFH